MKNGHEFLPEHGYTGSAHPSKEFRPSVPGFKRGGRDFMVAIQAAENKAGFWQLTGFPLNWHAS